MTNNAFRNQIEPGKQLSGFFAYFIRLWLLFQKFRRRLSCDLLEQAAEMVGIVEAQQVRNFAYTQTFHQEILGLVNHEIVYLTDGSSSCVMVNQVTEVTG